MRKVHRGVFRADQLVRSYARHLNYWCETCSAEVNLDPSDDRVGSGRAPRCPRCDEFCMPSHDLPEAS